MRVALKKLLTLSNSLCLFETISCANVILMRTIELDIAQLGDISGASGGELSRHHG
jgi:hypothetical protein